MGNNVILIGMPGAGKSTLGVVLAKTLGFRFLDSDLLIQEREGALLCEIIERKGLDGFLSIEEEVNVSIEAENTVIATGGSAVYGTRAMEHLKGIGTVIYIRLSLQEIISRVGDVKHRGIALREGQSFSQLYEQRCPLYEKYADIVIDAKGLPIEKLVKMMGNRLKGTILR